MSNEAEKLINRGKEKLVAEAQKELPRLTALALAHPLITLAIVSVLFYLVVTFGAGLIAGIRHKFEDRQVQQLEQKADQSEQNANKKIDEANEAAGDRQEEDTNRETNIRPRVEVTGRELEVARERRRKAEGNYENSRKNPRTDSDAGALHERNCAELRELYPGEPLAGCDR